MQNPIQIWIFISRIPIRTILLGIHQNIRKNTNHMHIVLLLHRHLLQRNSHLPYPGLILLSPSKIQTLQKKS